MVPGDCCFYVYCVNVYFHGKTISKVFDKVRHNGITFKLKQNGISDNLLNLLSNFLRNRK